MILKLIRTNEIEEKKFLFPLTNLKSHHFMFKMYQFFAELPMSQRLSAIFCAMSVCRGKLIGRVRVKQGEVNYLLSYCCIRSFSIFSVNLNFTFQNSKLSLMSTMIMVSRLLGKRETLQRSVTTVLLTVARISKFVRVKNGSLESFSDKCTAVKVKTTKNGPIPCNTRQKSSKLPKFSDQLKTFVTLNLALFAREWLFS